MAYSKVKPYVKAPAPPLNASDREWIKREFEKIQVALQSIVVLLEELVAQKQDIP